MKGNKKYICSLVLNAVLLLAIFVCVGGYANRIAVKLGLLSPTVVVNRTQEGWDNSLEQLCIRPDVIFIGDSLTYHGDFQHYFPDTTVLNLGVRGNSVSDVLNRCNILSSLSSPKVFLQVGINGLSEKNFESSLETYSKLVDTILKSTNSQVYIQSLLPITQEFEKSYVSNEIIREYNERLEDIAQKYGLPYIDLYGKYQVEGFLNDTMTVDGIHLKENAYSIWAEEIRDYIEE